MNIWCISKYASTPNYGTAARLFYLTKAFIKLGHNAILITSDSNHLAKFPNTDKKYNFEKIENVPVYWIKTKKYIKTASVARILSWLDFEKKLFGFSKNNLPNPEVVLVSSLSIFSIVYGFYLKKKYKSFLVFEIRDIWPLTMTEEAGFSKWHPLVLLIGYIEKFGYKYADLVVGTMPRLNRHIHNRLGYDKPFFCSPLGFNLSSYESNKMEVNNYFDNVFPSNKMIVGYAGSMGISNALDPFIQTIISLKNTQSIHFMLVGSGDFKGKYETLLAECMNVTFLDRLEQVKIKYFLDKCDILYLSTQDSKVWEYGQSMNKVVEYMLAAKPIIASYTGYPSMINEANCGIFIPTVNPLDIEKEIVKFLSMSSLNRIKMGKNGKDWIYKHREYEVLAGEYMDKILKMVIESKKACHD